ncbi:MAG TPA: hypothetical protein VGI66_18370 [Streptosporangiaceae bacterium]|jgi:hypothetical protein
MRKEIGGQVRKTFSGGRKESVDTWDAATTEIPPEVGESPECQWCPICRAARQFRDSGPGIGGHLSGAGNVVASAVQDAFNAFDAVLSKAAGTADRERQSATRPTPGAATATSDGRTADPESAPIKVTTAPIVVPGADSPKTPGRADPQPAAGVGPTGPPETAGVGPTGPPETARLGSPATEADTWSTVTDRTDGLNDADGADVTAGRRTEDDGGHGPDDRG